MIKPKEQMEMLKHTGYFLLISALMVTVQILTAQEVSDNEEITVEAPYQPSVSDAFIHKALDEMGHLVVMNKLKEKGVIHHEDSGC